MADFYLGNRRLGLFVLFLTLYATQYSGLTFIGFVGNVYRTGYFFSGERNLFDVYPWGVSDIRTQIFTDSLGSTAISQSATTFSSGLDLRR